MQFIISTLKHRFDREVAASKNTVGIGYVWRFDMIEILFSINVCGRLIGSLLN